MDDYTITMTLPALSLGLVLFVTLVYVLVNLAVDILYGFVDPRIQLGRND